MKRNISIVLALVMVILISVSAYAGGIGLTSGTDQKTQGLSLEEVEAARRIIAMVEERSRLLFARNYAIVEFWFCVYDLQGYKKYVTIVAKALYIIAESEGKNLNRVFFLNQDKSLVGHANKEIIIFSEDMTI